ncbi:hypothetical protein Q4Q52_01345 [Shewanella sp. SP1S2-4]|nr:hypothetical protein [Shewanella sp. SP1S2-4]
MTKLSTSTLKRWQAEPIRPTLATCTACHTLIDGLVVHARCFGGVYQSDASCGRIYPSGQESCATYHAEGRSLGGGDKVRQ